MSKYNLEKILKKELAEINELIDQKIVRGLSYSKEARRHRYILQSLSRIRRDSKAEYGWLTNSFSII